jgi:hypothetical protein
VRWPCPSPWNSSKKTEVVVDTKTQKTKAKSKYTKNEYLRAMLRVAQQQVAYRYLLLTVGTPRPKT